MFCGRFFILSYLATSLSADAHCLRSREKLDKVWIDGIDYKFRLAKGLWSSAAYFTEMLKILLEEELGYDVELVDSDSSVSTLRHLAGCSNPQLNCTRTEQERGLFEPIPKIWASAEVWVMTEEEQRLKLYSESAGWVGYASTPGLRALPSAFAKARSRGMVLEFWESLLHSDVRASCFSDVDSVNAALKSIASPGCSGKDCDSFGSLMPSCRPDKVPPTEYNEVRAGGFDCMDGWFYSSSCRNNRSTCIPTILGSFSWDMMAWIYDAERLNLPLAITTMRGNGILSQIAIIYELSALGHDVLFFWWGPDHTYIELKPKMIIFPAGLLTIPQTLHPLKLFWPELRDMEATRHALQLFLKASLSVDELNHAMENLANSSSYDLACDWLKQHKKTWQRWLWEAGGCPRGYVFDEKDKRCRICYPGTYASRNASGSCISCPPGRFTSLPGKPRCQPCRPGRFNPLPKQVNCAACPVGSRCTDNGTGNFPIESGFFLFGGNLSAGYELLAKAFNSSYVNRSLDSTKGFDGIGPVSCPVPAACLGNNKCLEGMEGPLCGICAAGYTRRLYFEPCGLCPDKFQTYLVLALAVLVFGLVVQFFDFINKASYGEPGSVAAVVPKIMCNYFILLASVGKNIRMADLIENTMGRSLLHSVILRPVLVYLGVSRGLENPSRSLFSLDCLLQNSDIEPEYAAIIIGWLIIPVALVGAAIWTFAVILPFHLCFNTAISKAEGASGYNGVKLRHSERVKNKADKFRRRLFRTFLNDGIRPVSLIILYLLQPAVTSMLLSIFECKDRDEVTDLIYPSRLLLPNTKINCDSDRHLWWSGCAGAGILVWSFGIPGYLFLKLRCIYVSSVKSLWSPAEARVFGFLYLGYQYNYYYFELVYMIKKALWLICVMNPWISREARTVVLLALAYVFTEIHIRCKPFDSRCYDRLDSLEIMSNKSLTLMLIGRLLELTLSSSEDFTILDRRGIALVAYLPAYIYTVKFLLFAGYLCIRPFVYSNGPEGNLCGRCALVCWGKRLHFSVFEKKGCFGDHRSEHFTVSSHELVKLMLKSDIKSCCGRLVRGRRVGQSERDVLCRVLSEAGDLLLRRYDFSRDGKSLEVISIPLFSKTLHRVLISCACIALRKRIKDKTELALVSKASSTPLVEGIKQLCGYMWDICKKGVDDCEKQTEEEENEEIQEEGEEEDTETEEFAKPYKSYKEQFDRSYTYKKEEKHKCWFSCKIGAEAFTDCHDELRRPLTSEELHDALYYLEPKLLGRSKHSDVLKSVIKHNKLLLEYCGNKDLIYQAESSYATATLFADSRNKSEPTSAHSGRHVGNFAELRAAMDADNDHVDNNYIVDFSEVRPAQLSIMPSTVCAASSGPRVPTKRHDESHLP